MPQVTDWSLDNLPGISFRAQLNGVVEALQSSNSGATAPSPTVPGMMWFDTGVSPAMPRQRNAANTAWVALGVSVDRIAQGNLSGSELIIAIPSEFEGIELSHWNYQPSTSGTALRMAIGSGTIGSPTWGANHYEQVQSVVITTYTPSVVGPLGYVNLSFDQLGAGEVPGSGRAVANGFHVLGFVFGETMRRGVISGSARTTSHGSFGEESSVVHTLIRIFVSAGTMTGSYRLLGYRKP